jgi:hypothetical protein
LAIFYVTHSTYIIHVDGIVIEVKNNVYIERCLLFTL